ncbi:SPOR domain-containing protein [Jannaschia ovalis]|uniref:SPOR domain-containing protein n=1 Tax=Jannaschia ovalis TaxID=3038773 RepID=A0ABY8LCY2_9RHOB|nr:SPOR domain-containing protein [Jannaschia sp. GRR-S6-38]WGH78991.1 SPOR domain-containing protein [Jannaschia sp. GRR-S6-38]
MADLDYFGADYGAEEPSRFMDAARNFGLANWAGALTSLGLTAGMAAWAVDLTFRDVSAVPVIAALEGPMRVAPEDPGGVVAPYQGMALSDITSGGAAAPAPDQIVLAPPPLDLDAPALGERLAAATTAAPAPAAPAPVSAPAITGKPAPVAISDALAGGGDQLVLASALATEPVEQELVGASAPAAQIAAPAPVVQTPSEPAVAALPTGPGLVRSARPAQRPGRPAARVAATSPDVAAAVNAALAAVPTDAPAAQAGTEVASAAATLDIDPASIAPGTRVVQLGAFDSEAVARSEWDRLEGRFRDYMAGKSRMIQKATSGGRDFWRLRVVGFADGSDARRFCSALLAQDAACIPVTVR